VLVAVKSLIDVGELRRILKISGVEFAAAMLTFAGVLLFGLLEGVFIGAIFSVLVMIKRISFPSVSVLGRIPGTRFFGDISRHQENERIPEILVYRVNGPIFYANATAVSDQIVDALKSGDIPVGLVVLDMEASSSLDVAGADALSELATQLEQQGLALRLAQTVGPVRDVLRASDAADKVGGVASGASISEVIDAWMSANQTEASS
jgi:MFS superfamily sulfate permease-like transporter